MEAWLTVALYCVCSGGMLIINKLAVKHIPAPAFVTFAQFLATVLGVYAGWLAGAIQIDTFDFKRFKHFAAYVLAFSCGTWANMKVLMVANVETVIVFRACAPLVVCVLDYFFYKRALPSPRSWLAMGLITLGATLYVYNDKNFETQGLSAYFWVAVWFSLLVFQLTYGKHLVTGLGLKSVWSPVLYTNSLSMIPTGIIGITTGEFKSLAGTTWTSPTIGFLLASCAVGMGISWAGFKCQSLITATSYTVVGVMNKMITVTVNVLIWDEHASVAGVASLCVCLMGGALYQQAPLRKETARYELLRNDEDNEEPDRISQGSGGASKSCAV